MHEKSATKIDSKCIRFEAKCCVFDAFILFRLRFSISNVHIEAKDKSTRIRQNHYTHLHLNKQHTHTCYMQSTRSLRKVVYRELIYPLYFRRPHINSVSLIFRCLPINKWMCHDSDKNTKHSQYTAQSAQTTHLCPCPSQKSPRKSIPIFHFGFLSVKRNYLFYFVVHDPCAIFLCHSFIGDKEIPTTNNNKYSFLWIKSDMRPSPSIFFIVRLFGVGCFIHLNIVVPLLRHLSASPSSRNRVRKKSEWRKCRFPPCEYSNIKQYVHTVLNILAKSSHKCTHFR